MLISFLAIFTTLVLLVVWLFQVVFLDSFYERSKMKELYLTASVIETNIQSDKLESTAYTMANDYSICVLVYKINGSVAKKHLSCDISSKCMLHHISTQSINKLYNKALNAGGEYTQKFALDAFRKDKTNNDSIYSTIYIKLIEDDVNNKYVIMLNAEMAPVNAIIKTYVAQFKWIGIIIFVIAIVASLIMSRKITAPIVKLNKSVKRLGKGDYNEIFDGKGYREIRELSDALNNASKELSKTDRLQKELLGNISHDLRTPLTMIRGYSEMMRDIPGENTPENMQVVIDETSRLSGLVDDLLDISKIQAGTRKATPERFPLTETIRNTLHRYDKLTEKDGYDIKFIYDEEVDIVADKAMMLQVIYNLINNAINYTGDNKKVIVRQNIYEGRVRISISDTGEGIPPEQLSAIWNRYYKVDKVHHRATVGTGIGLSIVKGLLELHGATYGVESTVGKGSTFWFELDSAQ